MGIQCYLKQTGTYVRRHVSMLEPYLLRSMKFNIGRVTEWLCY